MQSLLVPLLLILSISYVESYVTCKGIVPLDDITFDKVLCHHSVCIVLFHPKYYYGEAEKEFEKFALLAVGQSNILVAEIGTTDWGDQENHSIRERYDISLNDYPTLMLFHKDNIGNYTKYKGKISYEHLTIWVKEHTGIAVDDQPSISKVRLLAKQFTKTVLESPSSVDELQSMIQEADLIIKKFPVKTEKDSASVYVNTMKKLSSKGKHYLGDEISRLKNVLRKGDVKIDKKSIFKNKIETLKEFIKFTEELNH